MRRVKQSKLYFRQGKSDKVYEVDLCEVAADQFVVNFRYGRRGATLREGTKTTSPVALPDAERMFAELVDSKTSKGYQEGEIESRSPSPSPKTLSEADASALKSAVLNRIRIGQNANSSWRLSRAIWRAGELGLSEAEPLLHPLIGRDEMTDYCIAWTMGRLGQSNSNSVLESLAANESNREHVRHIATQALRLTADDAGKETLVKQAIESLPDPLRSFLQNNSPDAFHKAFTEGLNKQFDVSLLGALYYIDTSDVRRTLVEALANVPLTPPYFKVLRRIFKASELRGDGQVFGVLARRFETSKSGYRHPSYRWRSYKNPMAEPNPEYAFSTDTRQYMRRRSWRTLERMGNAQNEAYVRMAVGVLLAFTDDDAKPVRSDSRYDWRTRSYSYVHWDPFSSYWAFSQILYRNSPRYVANPGHLSFSVADGFDANSEPVRENEAAFPDLWKQQPRGLLHLLTDSRCLQVHQFASKTIRKCPEFCSELPVSVIVLLLGAKYEVTSELGLELATDRYDASNPQRDLVLALATSVLPRARRQAKEWIEAQRNLFFEDSDFAFQLLTCEYADSRQVASDSLHALNNDADTIRALAGRLIAFMQSCDVDKAEVAESVGRGLLTPTFSASMNKLGESVLCDLLASNVAEVQSFAGTVVLQHDELSKSPTERVLCAMLDASHAPVRSMAIRIISELPDDLLLNNVGMLATLTCHALEDIRNEIRPTVQRLADSNVRFGEEMVAELVRRLLVPGAPEGVPSHTCRVVIDDLNSRAGKVEADRVWSLLHSRSGPAQEVGGFLLPTNVDHSMLSALDIVKLTNHPILSVRRFSWELFEKYSDRMRMELGTAVRILDANWDDSRQFGFEFFRGKIQESDLTPTVLISVCDSVREDVQQFGRELITQRFAKEDGPEYLLKLSEHPSTEIQLFTSNFLQEYGAGNVERLQHLTPYFVSILSRVNKSRVAKDRVFEFLRAQAIDSEDSARIVSKILDRVSATCAIGDRANTIEAMLEIHERFPEIPLPLSAKPLEVR